MGIAKLAISDGTTEISLLDLTGIHLAEDDGWTPKIIQAKSGGVFQDSSMAAGRRLVYRQFGTAREDFTFNIMGISQDELIAETSDLLQMLEKAVNYWATDWQSDIVYLIAQSDCETYARYAPILYYEVPELQNTYGQPFVQVGEGAIFDDIGIMIERGHWQNVAPGDSECVETSSNKSWNYAQWELVESNATSFWGMAEHTASGNLFVGDTGNIWTSTDDGLTWAVNDASPTGRVYKIIETSSGTLIATDFTAAQQLWRSTNGGGSWTAITTSGLSNSSEIIELASGRILCGNMFYSDGDGVPGTWIDNSSADIYGATLFQASSGRIFASSSDVGAWYSDDNGVTWEVIPDLTNTISAAWPQYVEAINGTLFASQTTSSVGITTAILLKSIDNGESWATTLSFPGVGNTRIASILKDSDGNLYMGIRDSGDSSSALYKSIDNGESWKIEYAIPTSLSIQGIFQSSSEAMLLLANLDIYRREGNTSTNMGRSATCNNEVYLANKNNIANLSHIFIDDGGSFGSNLIPMSVFPIDLLPAAISANDAIYFGISTDVSDSGPFSSLVFDLATAMSGSYDLIWEYYNGGWVTLTTKDNTSVVSPFGRTGVNSVHWEIPSDWTSNAINGVTAYWIRLRVTSGTVSPATQQNRNIYTIVNGYIDIDELQVLGDIPATMQNKLMNRSDEDGPSGNAPDLYSNRILVGLRSYDRGNNFQSYINISDEQSPFGITISTGTNTTFSTDTTAPTGRSATYNPGGVEAMTTRATVTLSTTVAQDYYGSYHTFLRVQRTAGASTDFDVQLVFVTGSGGIQKTTESKQVQTTTAFELLDFGQVTMPVGGSLASSDLGDQIQVLIQASAASGTPNLVLYDLILIPVDEWAIDSVDQTNSSTSDIGRSGDISKLLDIDSVTDPKNPIKSIVRQVGSEFVTANYNPITNGPAILQSNADQRLWFLAAQTSATGSSYSWIAPPEIVHSIQLYKAQRYLGLRGNR